MADKDHPELLDPLQGFDIKVQVQEQTSTGGGTGASRLIGAFTSLMFKIVNQTETYLPLNSRIPRMLDGEIIVVWSLEQGLVDLNVVANTFGSDVATKFKEGRSALIPRQKRFSILFQTNLAVADTGATTVITSDTSFRQDKAKVAAGTKYSIDFCRVDTMNFGVTAGRHVVANTWQGTAQNLATIAGS